MNPNSLKAMPVRHAVASMAAAVVGWTSASAAYVDGFVWDRSVDWANDTSDSGNPANPTLDSQGNGAWTYYQVTNNAFDRFNNPDLDQDDSPIVLAPWTQTVTVDVTNNVDWTKDEYRLGGTSVWYRRLGGNTDSQTGNTYAQMTTYRTSSSSWQIGTNAGARVEQDNIRENGGSFASGWQTQALIEWQNPTGTSQVIDITGNLTIDSNPNLAYTDYVIAHYDGSSWTELFTGTLAGVGGPNVVLPVDIKGLTVGVDDIIVISSRSLQNNATLTADGDDDFTFSGGSSNAELFDNLQLTIVPEPASLALIGLGSLCVLSRQRRS